MNEKIPPLPHSELSQRQRQILKLLQAGKVNKEVARELGIEVGTVKQHIVALFKKLNVRNRAMAVSRGMDMLHEQENQGTALTVDGLLERRPCVALSFSLPEGCSQLATRLMYGTLAELASSNDAVFLARKGNAVDVIFGIQRVTEYDVAVAIQTALAVYHDMLKLDAGMAGTLRGCITSGLSIASMKRFGGWTGEAIVSAVIASARELLNGTPAGMVSFDSEVLNLIDVFGVSGAQEVGLIIPIHDLQKLRWTGSRRSYPVFGRDAEYDLLVSALNTADPKGGQLFHLEGEMGMGKSLLCEAITKRCRDLKIKATFFRCLPAALGEGAFDVGNETTQSFGDIEAALYKNPAGLPELMVIDDFHVLSAEKRERLSVAVMTAVNNGLTVILSGRKLGGERSSKKFVREILPSKIYLRRLSSNSLELLIKTTLAKGVNKTRLSTVQNIVDMASGVPLFAIELSRQHAKEGLTLPLLIVISARLDSLSLDRKLLRCIARSVIKPTVGNISEALGDETDVLQIQIDRAIHAGVLLVSSDGCLSFAHPLLRLAIDSLVIE